MVSNILSERSINDLINFVPKEIINSAREIGCELYMVGGSVRDFLLGKPVNDIDFSVVGNVEDLVSLVSQKTGSKRVSYFKNFGTAMISFKGQSFEFAVSRSESYNHNSRKPIQITPVPIESDLQRRDFTINALAYGLSGVNEGRLLDGFSGMIDLERKIIKTPLAPELTFSDDPLRMLRGIRFASELGFSIESSTWQGIKSNISRISIVAPERIKEEFFKILRGKDPVRAVILLIESGLLDKFMKEISAMKGVEQVGRHRHKDVLLHSLKVMQNVVENSTDPILRLAALLHDIGKPSTKRFISGQGWTFHGHEAVGARMVRSIGKRLCFGREITDKLSDYVAHHMRPVNLTSEGVTDSAIRRLMFDCADSLDEQLILCRADITTANAKLVKKYLTNFEEMQSRMNDVDARDRMRNFNSPVRGEEIIEICNIKPGPLVGALKERVEDAILDGIIPYEYEAAKDYLLSIKEETITLDVETLNLERKKRSHLRNRITNDFKFPDES